MQTDIQTYTQRRHTVMASESTHYTLKAWIRAMELADPVDAVSNCKILLALSEHRLNELFGDAKTVARAEAIVKGAASL